jgi:excinuclease ABC subunit C
VLDHPIKSLLSKLPTTPGCYIYRGDDDGILYVGKAKNIRKRVTSYFQNYDELTARIQIMIDNAVNVETHPVSTEVEALILEASLIKKYKPKYNVLLKDDKSYSWIKVTKDPYPIIYRTRSIADKKAIYFGPYTSVTARDQVYDFLRKEFPFRTCSYVITDEDLEERKRRRAEGEHVRSRLCTFYHIGRCGGPCEGLVSHDDYLENVDSIKKYLKNRKKSLVLDLQEKMKYWASTQQFEKAAKTKQQIDSLEFISQKLMIGHGDDEDDVRRISYQRSMKGLERLIKELKIKELKNLSKEEKAKYLENFRIECFDISNIQGTNPVGAMVVNVGSLMKKEHYRKFKINIKETPDDFAMMTEMLTRRFRYLRPKQELEDLDNHNAKIVEKLGIRHLSFRTKRSEDPESDSSLLQKIQIDSKSQILSSKILRRSNQVQDDKTFRKLDESFSSVPDLIIIDGGKGQLGVAVTVLHDMKLDHLKLGGLAKRREEIFLPGEKKSYLFDDKKETLFLIQRIRDEAHRFGITYHRLRRSKAMLGR